MRKLKSRPEDEELKELYGLYKQSVIGDINIGGTRSLFQTEVLVCTLLTEVHSEK